MKMFSTIVFFILGLFGCKSINQNDIPGIWVVSEESRTRYIPTEKKNEIMAITFDNNGKFIATNIPEDLLSDQQDSKIRLFSGEGKWKFISIGGDDMLQLNFQDVSLKNHSKMPMGTQLYLKYSWLKPVLFFFLGDPDEGRKIEFEKK